MNDGELSASHYASRRPVRLSWQRGIIVTIEPTDTAPDGVWIAPGLVDLQVNGYAGIDFQQDDLTAENLLHAARELRNSGCTRFLLTLITDTWPRLTHRLRHLAKLRQESPELMHAIAGWHLEGPFLSSKPGFHGAHNPGLMLDPTTDHIQELREITGTDPLLLTLAPERDGALAAIRKAVGLGIKISLGHTDASAEILKLAVAAGATGFTHLGNGCPRELDRHDNILWRVLETPGLSISLIPDRTHVSPALFRLIHRLVELPGIYYTTDAMSAAGAKPGRHRLGSLEMEVGSDQIVRQPGATNFAGSALRPFQAIERATEMLNCPWPECWARYSDAAAQFLGLPSGLQVGARADFNVLQSVRGKLTRLGGPEVCVSAGSAE